MLLHNKLDFRSLRLTPTNSLGEGRGRFSNTGELGSADIQPEELTPRFSARMQSSLLGTCLLGELG